MNRVLLIGLITAAATTGWAQEGMAAPASGLMSTDLASSWWAVIGMGLVLCLAWGITRFIAQPILSRLDQTDQQPAESSPTLAPAVPVAGPAFCLSVGDLELDPIARRVSVAHEEVPLTSTEFDLLRFFLEHEGQALSRADLLREVWGHQQPVYSRTVDTHVQRLRDKLGPCRDQLETVRGVGYRLNAPVMV